MIIINKAARQKKERQTPIIYTQQKNKKYHDNRSKKYH